MLLTDDFSDLITYCARQNVPFTVFNDWASILSTVKDITSGKTSVQEAAREGYESWQKGQSSANGHANGHVK